MLHLPLYVDPRHDLSNRPLVHVGMSLFLHFESHLALGCDESTLKNWLTIIELNYHSTNSYHNSSHGADVMQAAAGFLKTDRLMQTLDSLDRAICLIAAAAHDVDHPGKSSAFLCNSDSDLSLLYNDLSVLESHHAALTFKLTMSDERVNIFKGLERDTYKVVRQNIIDMILATEMTRHFEHLAKFVNVFCKGGMQDEENAETDEEKANNLPVVMPLFDRSTCSIPKSQIGFMEFIIRDMFEAWEAFIEMPELLQYMERNYIFWKDLEERGISSIQDIIKNQRIEQYLPGCRENLFDKLNHLKSSPERSFRGNPRTSSRMHTLTNAMYSFGSQASNLQANCLQYKQGLKEESLLVRRA
uniref:(California timema) hypothetical protein n=1 Tax=Timema californicum TaxID=61474 RepID=A0A7R9IV13_TIMCA|nr:unnamed protein product [Timema californicum]